MASNPHQQDYLSQDTGGGSEPPLAVGGRERARRRDIREEEFENSSDEELASVMRSMSFKSPRSTMAQQKKLLEEQMREGKDLPPIPPIPPVHNLVQQRKTPLSPQQASPLHQPHTLVAMEPPQPRKSPPFYQTEMSTSSSMPYYYQPPLPPLNQQYPPHPHHQQQQQQQQQSRHHQIYSNHSSAVNPSWAGSASSASYPSPRADTATLLARPPPQMLLQPVSPHPQHYQQPHHHPTQTTHPPPKNHHPHPHHPQQQQQHSQPPQAVSVAQQLPLQTQHPRHPPQQHYPTTAHDWQLVQTSAAFPYITGDNQMTPTPGTASTSSSAGIMPAGSEVHTSSAEATPPQYGTTGPVQHIVSNPTPYITTKNYSQNPFVATYTDQNYPPPAEHIQRQQPPPFPALPVAPVGESSSSPNIISHPQHTTTTAQSASFPTSPVFYQHATSGAGNTVPQSPSHAGLASAAVYDHKLAYHDKGAYVYYPSGGITKSEYYVQEQPRHEQGKTRKSSNATSIATDAAHTDQATATNAMTGHSSPSATQPQQRFEQPPSIGHAKDFLPHRAEGVRHPSPGHQSHDTASASDRRMAAAIQDISTRTNIAEIVLQDDGGAKAALTTDASPESATSHTSLIPQDIVHPKVTQKSMTLGTIVETPQVSKTLDMGMVVSTAATIGSSATSSSPLPSTLYPHQKELQSQAAELDPGYFAFSGPPTSTGTTCPTDHSNDKILSSKFEPLASEPASLSMTAAATAEIVAASSQQEDCIAVGDITTNDVTSRPEPSSPQERVGFRTKDGATKTLGAALQVARDKAISVPSLPQAQQQQQQHYQRPGQQAHRYYHYRYDSDANGGGGSTVSQESTDDPERVLASARMHLSSLESSGLIEDQGWRPPQGPREHTADLELQEARAELSAQDSEDDVLEYYRQSQGTSEDLSSRKQQMSVEATVNDQAGRPAKADHERSPAQGPVPQGSLTSPNTLKFKHLPSKSTVVAQVSVPSSPSAARSTPVSFYSPTSLAPAEAGSQHSGGVNNDEDIKESMQLPPSHFSGQMEPMSHDTISKSAITAGLSRHDSTERMATGEDRPRVTRFNATNPFANPALVRAERARLNKRPMPTLAASASRLPVPGGDHGPTADAPAALVLEKPFVSPVNAEDNWVEQAVRTPATPEGASNGDTLDESPAGTSALSLPLSKLGGQEITGVATTPTDGLVGETRRRASRQAPTTRTSPEDEHREKTGGDQPPMQDASDVAEMHTRAATHQLPSGDQRLAYHHIFGPAHGCDTPPEVPSEVMDYVQLVDLENLTPGFEIDFGEDDDDIEEIHVSSDDDKLYESADGNLPLRSRKATNDAQECQPNASSLVAESLSRLPQNERQLSTLKWLRGQSAGTLEFPSPSGDQGADLSSEYEEGNSLLSSLNLSRVLRRRSSLPLEVAAASSGKQRFTPSSSQILPNDSGFAGENYNRCNPQRKTAPPSRRKAVGNTAAATYPPPSFGPSQAPHRHASHARHHSVAEANTRSGARKSHRITARAKGNGAGQETADVNYPITPFTATVRMTSMDKPTHAPAPIITTPTDTPADYRHDFAHPSEHSSDVAQDDGPRAPPPTTALQGIPSLERTDRRHILALAKELPLHVLTVAGKLELALCREQEDFASGNLKEFCPPALRAELHFLIRNLIFVQKVAASLSAACSSPEDEAQIAAELDTLTNEFSHMYLTSADVLLYFRQTGMNAIFPQLMKRLDWEYRNPGRNYVYHQFEQGDVPGATNDLDEEGGSVLDEVDTATLGNQLPQSIILSAATIPKSTLTHRVIEDGESAPYGRQSGFCGHLEHMSAVNQVVVTATQLYYRLESEFVPKSDIIAKDRIYASGDIIAHQLSVLYHSLGGEFKKYRPHVEKHFNIAKSWGTLSHSVARRKSGPSGGANESEDKGMAEYIDKLKLLLAEIVTDALYSAKAKVELPESRFPPLIHGGARDADGRRHGARESRWVVPAPIHNVTAHSILRYLNYELPPPPKKRESGATGNKGRTNLEHRKGNKHHTNSDNGKGGGGGGGGRPPIPPFLADRTAKPSL